MTAMPMQPGGLPPGVGLVPPPSTGMPYQPEVDVVRHDEAAELEHQHEWAEYDAGAAEPAPPATTEELEREAEQARRHINDSVNELRERLGLDPDAEHAHGPFAPVRRHPFTVAVAAAGAVTTAVVTVAVARGHRKAEKRSARDSARSAAANAATAVKLAAGDARKNTRRSRRNARKKLNRAAAAVGSAADRLRFKRRSKLRRLLHR
ncbi:hypothetical protein [Glycomyces terrestris]|uniref:DUF3618 domain-containing protein n=1 Tax=Glycomyces terrestris TaxID=2493553 RepID=A0A426V558_9ACTN|nr:hypothetical protein [Glycomyces terrestris]RRS01948.1 hypothetical protein EIW28_04175 [Glycomyces terrestris]